MHPTDFDLVAQIHGETVQAAGDVIRRHLEECHTCFDRRESLAREESDQRRLLQALDVPVPQIPIDAIRRRARIRRTSGRIAASIGVLVTLASAAAAIPGSPVRQWLRRLSAPAAPLVPVPKPNPAADGIQVAAAGSLVIMLGTPQDSGQVRIVRVDLATASVRAVGGDVGYRVGPGRINLDNRLPAVRYEITIPRSLERFAFLAGGRLLLRIDPRHPLIGSDTLTIDFSRHGGTTP